VNTPTLLYRSLSHSHIHTAAKLIAGNTSQPLPLSICAKQIVFNTKYLSSEVNLQAPSFLIEKRRHFLRFSGIGRLY
jgi:hypothetical protein